jgi:hypothetical protein
MKTKRQLAVFVAALTLTLVGSARANLILFDTYKDTPEDTDHIVSVASAKLGESFNSLLRLDDLATLSPGGPISITYFALDSGSGSNPNNAANISWDFTGTGAQLLAVYVFGGSNGANLYKVTDVAQMTSGSATVHTPVTGNSGAFATISHILFLGTGTLPGNNVPDSGTTVAMFAVGLGALGLARLRFS